jgi:hypothetical protein
MCVLHVLPYVVDIFVSQFMYYDKRSINAIVFSVALSVQVVTFLKDNFTLT